MTVLRLPMLTIFAALLFLAAPPSAAQQGAGNEP